MLRNREGRKKVTQERKNNAIFLGKHEQVSAAQW
jgi:hypothetical protein